MRKLSKAQIEAFRRGAELMRELAAQTVEMSPTYNARTTVGVEYANRVRAIPTPDPVDKHNV